MERITRKEFENLLTSKESYFIQASFYQGAIEKVLEAIKEKENYFLENQGKFELRSAIKHSNSLEFKSVKINEKKESSWLYFNENGTKRFYKFNDFVVYHYENVNFIVYLIKQ
jgi:hypothetical protein